MRIIYWISDVCSSDPTYANIITMYNASCAALNDPAQFPYHFAFANSKSQDVAAMTAGTKKLVELGTIDDVEKVATLIYNSGVSQIVQEAMEKQFPRSEEHTSELQSLMRISYAVFCLKKKNTKSDKKLLNKQH